MPTEAVTVTRYGGPEVLELRERPLPEPGPGEVRVAVEAAALCYTDMLIRRNLYPDNREKPPFTIGYDWVGRIEAVGSGVSGWAVGERVADLSTIGGAARHLTVSADRLVGVPGHLDAAEAEVMVLTYLTALQALTREGGAKAGDSVLVLGASGAVGLAALDVARAMGMRATGVASSKHEADVTGRGAAHVAYDAAGYERRLKEASEAVGGFACIVDTAASLSAARLIRMARRGGALVRLGFAGRVDRTGGPGRMVSMARVLGSVAATQAARLAAPGVSSSFYSIYGMRTKHPDWYAEDLRTLFGWLEAGNVKPEIAARYPFAQAVEGHRHLERGGFAGRLVLVPD